MATLNTVTSSTRPASPTAGEAYFETDTNKIVVYNGTTWTEIVSDGTLGSSFSNASVDFDGSNDFVSFGSVTALNSASAFSVSVWYKKVSTSNEGMIVGSGTANDSFYIQHYNDNKFYIGFGSTYAAVSAAGDTNWHHAVYVTDSGTHKLYWDATDMSLGGTPPSTTWSNLGDTFYLGKWNAYAPHFGGLIDEVSVFNSALSASDITSIYNSGVPNDISALSPVGWWRMGDGTEAGSGTTLYDMSSNSNNGTLTNGPTFSSSVPS